MKTINLLKEGHGLRYSPAAQPDKEELDPIEAMPPSLGKPRGGAGKTLVALVLVVLLAGGGWWAYQRFGQQGLSLQALRQSLPGWLASKLPGARPPAPAPAPSAATSPPPPAPKTTQAKAPPQPPSPPTVKAAQVGQWYRSDRAYPFTILVASFRKGATAVTYAGRLAQSGHPVTVAPTDLGTRGRWHRVVLARYGARSEARKAATRLKGKNHIDDAIALQLPFAVEVGRERERAAAEATQKALAAKGFLSHIFPEAAGPEEPVTFLLLAGAFPSKSQAEAFATTLRQAGRTAEVVTP